MLPVALCIRMILAFGSIWYSWSRRSSAILSPSLLWAIALSLLSSGSCSVAGKVMLKKVWNWGFVLGVTGVSVMVEDVVLGVREEAGDSSFLYGLVIMLPFLGSGVVSVLVSVLGVVFGVVGGGSFKA